MAVQCSSINAYLVVGAMPQDTSTQPATYMRNTRTRLSSNVEIKKSIINLTVSTPRGYAGGSVSIVGDQTIHCRPPLWSSGQSSWLHNGDVLCLL
jgi:hypothetical protein